MNNVKKHIKTHPERSNDDRAAIATLCNLFKSVGGRINTNFSSDDKWPNHDGTFEFVSNPSVSRQPDQSFDVQIKGTKNMIESNGTIKYTLSNLAFPAYIHEEKTLNPGILFIVMKPSQTGEERVFWKYMSEDFINKIDFNKLSCTINFTPDDEIKSTNEDVLEFCKNLEGIVESHKFIKKLEDGTYSQNDAKNIIEQCNLEITEAIGKMEVSGDTRDQISRRILCRLENLCMATMILTLGEVNGEISVRLAFEKVLLKRETKYLANFFKGLKYMRSRIPEDGQSERLMLKYYNFLWEIRSFLSINHKISILKNLEKFPLNLDKIDQDYFELIAKSIDFDYIKSEELTESRFYIQKKTPFFVGRERYFEITLQLAEEYSSKYNRITVYSKEDISSNYTIRIDYVERDVILFGSNSKIKVVTNWEVSIDPRCLNKLSKLLNSSIVINETYNEYKSLMKFLTVTDINFLELIDMNDDDFKLQLSLIYKDVNAENFMEIILKLRNNYSKNSRKKESKVVRYLILHLREEVLESITANQYTTVMNDSDALISARCLPFCKNPYIFNLVGRKTTDTKMINDIISVTNRENLNEMIPYIVLDHLTKKTRELYFELDKIVEKEDVDRFNVTLDNWDRGQGYTIKYDDKFAWIENYEKTTIDILKRLMFLSKIENQGQQQVNNGFIKKNGESFGEIDDRKMQAIREAFVNSRILLIYGAAGTGKTTLINHISNLMDGRKKLFLTKTYAALQNLQGRIKNPGSSSCFISMDSFKRKTDVGKFDVIFIDECSVIDNAAMITLLNKVSEDTFLILAGDTYQIESINFGNWFSYAKDLIKNQGANVELLGTWRSKEKALVDLWKEVREKKQHIVEKLVIDGPFSENIGEGIFQKADDDDEVVLCLNYDGRFGLNNINSYFQNANKKSDFFIWKEWRYKKGDPILFNESKRFKLLHNNLKGKIVDIEKLSDEIIFTIDIDMSITQVDCTNQKIDYISNPSENQTRIRFSVFENTNFDEKDRKTTVVPFQIAYAVSIHKAQGLEYNSVKVIIPNNISERITHGVFYTAITRAREKMKIYWSAETMKKIIESFLIEEESKKSLEIIKEKLK